MGHNKKLVLSSGVAITWHGLTPVNRYDMALPLRFEDDSRVRAVEQGVAGFFNASRPAWLAMVRDCKIAVPTGSERLCNGRIVLWHDKVPASVDMDKIIFQDGSVAETLGRGLTFTFTGVGMLQLKCDANFPETTAATRVASVSMMGLEHVLTRRQPVGASA